MNCTICGQTTINTVYDKSVGTVVSVCMNHANSVFEYGSASYSKDFKEELQCAREYAINTRAEFLLSLNTDIDDSGRLCGPVLEDKK